MAKLTGKAKAKFLARMAKGRKSSKKKGGGKKKNSSRATLEKRIEELEKRISANPIEVTRLTAMQDDNKNAGDW